MEAASQDAHQEPQQEGGSTTAGDGASPAAILTPSFPLGRVRKIMKLDQDIKKVNSEALLLVSLSVDLFLESLAERAAAAALAKKRRIIKLDHLRSAVRAHPPTAEFLLDCLPEPVRPAAAAAARQRYVVADNPLPAGARRIEDFFGKSSAGTPQ